MGVAPGTRFAEHITSPRVAHLSSFSLVKAPLLDSNRACGGRGHGDHGPLDRYDATAAAAATSG
jgi:hypothetical protein